jgi:hypothetical protein
MTTGRRRALAAVAALVCLALLLLCLDQLAELHPR